MDPVETVVNLATAVGETPYSRYERWKDLKIVTSDGVSLYYCKYKLAMISEWFSTLFSTDLRGSRDDVVEINEYGSADVIRLLEVIDDEHRVKSLRERGELEITLVDMLNYYQFTTLLKDVLQLLSQPDYGNLRWLSALYVDKYLKGPYMREFTDLTDTMVVNFVDNVLLRNTESTSGIGVLLEGLHDVDNLDLCKRIITQLAFSKVTLHALPKKTEKSSGQAGRRRAKRPGKWPNKGMTESGSLEEDQ